MEVETISAAAQRLLQRLEQRADKASRSRIKPGEIQSSTDAPRVEKKAGEIGAYSSLLAGQSPIAWEVGGGWRRDLKAVAVCPANDNAGWTSGEYDHRASPTLNPDDSAMPKTARIVTLRGFGEF